MASTEGFQGIAVPSSTPPEGVTSNRYARPASWPTTALEDVAQIIGGRIRTAKRPARESAGPGRQRHKLSQVRKAKVCLVGFCVSPGFGQARPTSGHRRVGGGL